MSNSKLKPRYDIFGAERLKDATFTGRFDFPFTPGTVLHESTLDGIPFDHNRSTDATLAGARGTMAMINVKSASLVLENCEFRANRLPSRPGGIIKFNEACGGSALKNCLFAGNQMTDPDNTSVFIPNGAGAGIVQLARTDATAARNDWSLPVEGCTFAYNFYDAIVTGSLGGIYVDNGTANVTNCIFYGNAAGQRAVGYTVRHGIYCTGYGRVSVDDSLFESQSDLADVSEGGDCLVVGTGVTYGDPKLFSTKADFQALFDSSVTTFAENGDVTAPQYARFRSDALSDTLALDCNRIPVAGEGDIGVFAGGLRRAVVKDNVDGGDGRTETDLPRVGTAEL